MAPSKSDTNTKLGFMSNTTGPVSSPTTTRNTSLPDELILTILEIVLHLNNRPQSNRTLRSAVCVCRRWRSLASPLLLSYVEIATAAEISSLLSPTHPTQLPIKTLITATCPRFPNLIDFPSFARLLQRASGIRKLVLLHTDARDHPFGPHFTAPKELAHLTSLVDVTIAPLSLWNTSRTEAGLINGLPSSVRWLQLPYTGVVPPDPIVYPAFSLFGLTSHQYPALVTDWILHGSKTSLQSLVVRRLDDIPRLAGDHPNLRSLKVFGRIASSPLGFQNLSKLERLDIRGLHVSPALLDTLPASLQYLRIWSTPLAVKLCTLLTGEGWSTALRVITWDHMFADDAESVSGQSAMRLLKWICPRKGIELRLSMDARSRMACINTQADVVANHEEEAFRKSCFDMDNGPTSGPAPTYVKLPRAKFPYRIISAVQKQSVPLGPSFTVQEEDQECAAMWDECFEGHGFFASTYSTSIIQAEAQATEALQAQTRAELQSRRRERWVPGRAVALFTLTAAITVGSTVISYTVSMPPDALVGALGGGAVIMLMLTYVLSFHWLRPVPPPHRRQRVAMGLAVGAQMILVPWQTELMIANAKNEVAIWISVVVAVIMDVASISLFALLTRRYFPC